MPKLNTHYVYDCFPTRTKNFFHTYIDIWKISLFLLWKKIYAEMHDIIYWQLRIRHRFFWWNIIIFWFSNAFFSRSADHHIFFSSAFDRNKSLHIYFCICYRFLKSEWNEIQISDSRCDFCYNLVLISNRRISCLK